MGRSQVAFNQKHGRPGRKGKGRGHNKNSGRGRGGGGRVDGGSGSGKRSVQQYLGDNSFRYDHQPQSTIDTSDLSSNVLDGRNNYEHLWNDDDDDYMTRTRSARLTSIPKSSYYDHDDEFRIFKDNDHSSSKSNFLFQTNIHTLDVQQFSNCLNKMDRSLWMRLSDRMTDIFDQRVMKKLDGKMTATEMYERGLGSTQIPAPTSATASISEVEKSMTHLNTRDDDEDDGTGDNIDLDIRSHQKGEDDNEDDEENEENDGNEEEDEDDDDDLDGWLDSVIDS